MLSTDMSNLSMDSASDKENASPDTPKVNSASSSKSSRFPVFSADFEDELDWRFFQDSITKRRRQGVYRHRPPVWCLGPYPNQELSATSEGCSLVCDGLENNTCEDDCCIEEPGHRHLYAFRSRDTTDLKPYTGQHTRCYYPSILKSKKPIHPTTNWKQEILSEVGPAATNVQAPAKVSLSETSPEIPVLKALGRECYTKHRPDSTPTEAVDVSNFGWSLKRSLPNRSSLHRSFRQTKAGLCTRLQSYKDIRLGEGEKWAIQEGSLVVCIDPLYTHLDHKERHPDEFEFASGDVYIVCRLYADLWALCAKVSLTSHSESHYDGASDNYDTHFAFLPLCTVTLAANLSAFIKRCSRYTQSFQQDTRYPGNGLPVTPPERSHSLNASKQIFQTNTLQMEMPPIILDIRSQFSPDETERDFVPLDSTLEPLFSRFGGRRERVHQLGRRMSLGKLWYGAKNPELRLGGEMNGVVRSGHDSSFASQGRNSQGCEDYQGPRQIPRRKESSSTSQRPRWLRGTSIRNQVRGQRSIRNFISNGSEWLRGNPRSSSTGSDPMCY